MLIRLMTRLNLRVWFESVSLYELKSVWLITSCILALLLSLFGGRSTLDADLSRCLLELATLGSKLSSELLSCYTS